MTQRLSAFVRLALASLCLMFATGSVLAADYVIKDEHGGDLKTYWNKFVEIRKSGEKIVIDGNCFSACTLVVSVMPRDRICVTSNAKLAFHAAVDHVTRTLYQEANDIMYKVLPADFQAWTKKNDAFRDVSVRFLQGPELEALVKPCPPNTSSAKPSQTTGVASR